MTRHDISASSPTAVEPPPKHPATNILTKNDAQNAPVLKKFHNEDISIGILKIANIEFDKKDILKSVANIYDKPVSAFCDQYQKIRREKGEDVFEEEGEIEQPKAEAIQTLDTFDRYIPYVFGGGYILSQDLVQYFAQNAPICKSSTMKIFQLALG